MNPQQICIIGGTFNPVHLGHLQMARSAQAQSMADEVWFMPAGQPWQKEGTGIAPAEVRVRMLELATQGVHSWRVERMEVDSTEPTYTVNTLEALCEKHPEKRFSFIIGADQLENLTTWKHWQSLFDFARIGVVDRLPWDTFKVPAELKRHLMQDRLFRIPMPTVNVSSTEIRHCFESLQTSEYGQRQAALLRLEASLPGPVFRYLQNNPVYGRLNP